MIAVHGREIAEAAILEEMQYHPAASREEAFAEATEALVVRELLLQRANAVGLEWVTDDAASEEKVIEDLLARELKLPEEGVEVRRRYYDQNVSKFKTQTLFEASHILYLAPREDAAARHRARAHAQQALAILKREPERFAELARAESQCASAGAGGHLGQVAAGETTPQIDTFLQSLEDGQLCPVPIETDYGVHVLWLHRRIEGRQIPFEEVEEMISRYLRGSVWRAEVCHYIHSLFAQASIPVPERVNTAQALRSNVHVHC